MSSTAKRSRKGKAFKIERKRATVAAGDKEENMAPGGKKFVEILIQLTIGYIALLRTKDFGLFTPLHTVKKFVTMALH